MYSFLCLGKNWNRGYTEIFFRHNSEIIPVSSIMEIILSEELKGRSHRFVLRGTSKEEALQSAANILTDMGYQLKLSQWHGDTYAKGNLVLRILLGAFVKYNKVMISAEGEGDISLTIENKSHGFSGGIIGMSQVKKEYQRILTAFEEKLGSSLY